MTRAILKEWSGSLVLKTNSLLETESISVNCLMTVALSKPEATRYPLYTSKDWRRSASNILVTLSLWATPLMIAGDFLLSIGVQDEGSM